MGLPPLRWMLRRDLLARREGDPMLPRGARKCWCAECGLYFNSLSGFTEHLAKGGGCLPVRVLRERGWTQLPSGHWVAETGERLAQIWSQDRGVQPIERRSPKI